MVFKRTMPLDRKEMIKQQAFLKIYLDTYKESTAKLPARLTDKHLTDLFRRCLRLFYRSARTYSYLIPVTPKLIPEALITDGLGPILE